MAACSLGRRHACPFARILLEARAYMRGVLTLAHDFVRVCGRGGIGRRAGFRYQYRKMWGFESLRPHQFRPTQAFAQINSRNSRVLNPMQIKETANEGLKRAYAITIPAKEIDARIDSQIKKIAPQVKMPGFRPGKVPANLVRKMHGEQLHA